jgi:deoxyribose-phosphate aldolase
MGEAARLSAAEIARMIDVSAVKAEDSEEDVQKMVETARGFGCIAVIPLPAMTALALRLLEGDTRVVVGGVAGFPSGGETTATKVFQTREMIQAGCREIDIVLTVGLLRSGRTGRVTDDIRAVVQEAGCIPVKVILECHHLTESQILAGCDCVVEAGAAWVKTSTGWPPTGATPENISMIKGHVGERVGVKAAGGIRDLATLLELYRRGARRFGLGWRTASGILEQVRGLPGGVAEL